jgi:Rha family phage regulatory protein
MQNQLVHQSGDRLVVTTLEISNRFGKQHKDVLKAIGNLECSQEFNRRNFAPISYNDGHNRPQPAYEITRDGFTFLCMGFTGQQAALWKERYIEAFNQMEAALRGDVPALRRELPLALENGHLKDQILSRDKIIVAKDGVIMGLQSQLIGSLYGQNKLLKRVDNLQKAQAKREAKQLIIRMESEGKPRTEIVELSGKKLNHVRQVIWQARQDGTLPKEGGAA